MFSFLGVYLPVQIISNEKPVSISISSKGKLLTRFDSVLMVSIVPAMNKHVNMNLANDVLSRRTL